MKNKNFFYLQYNKINWENQEKTKINYFVYKFIIDNLVIKNSSKKIKIFDIGFGIGLFIKMLIDQLERNNKEMIIAGCEPSDKNYKNFTNQSLINKKEVKLSVYNKTFQDLKTNGKFDFITAIYVFPHFTFEDLKKIVKKIHDMLDDRGKFILVVAEEKYFKEKLRTKKDLFIEQNVINFNSKSYIEFLHYSDIPKIGKVIDYNREEAFYIDFFKKNNFKLNQKKNLNDNNFICTTFVFEKR